MITQRIMLSTDQFPSPRARCSSEPPSFPRLAYFRMPADPSGRYKGSNYDPMWYQKKPNGPTGSGASGPPAFSSDINTSAIPRNRQNGYTNHYGSASGSNGPSSAPLQQQQQAQDPRNGYGYGYTNGNGNGIGRRSPRSPSPTKRGPAPTGNKPTGPASMKTVPLPKQPKAELWSSGSTRASAIDATSSEYETAPESQTRNSAKVELASSPVPGPNSPTYKLHPSRLNLVPQASPSVSSPLNPARTPTSVGTPSRDVSTSKSKPAPLNFTPVGTPKEAIKTPATAAWTPSLIVSPASKSPLDSLDKLRRFKEQVAASRKSVNSMSGLEMSKLAQVAETFLKSQDPAASDHAYQELVKLTGSGEDSSSRPSEPAEKPPPPSVPAPPAPPATEEVKGKDKEKETSEMVSSAAARAAILKERLLASKREGTSQSPRAQDAAKPEESRTDVNISTGTKRDRDQGHGPETENDEQKRYRAAVWAHQKATEPEKRDQQRQHQDRQSARSEREEGEWDGYDSRASVPSPRMERQLSLQERISDRGRHVPNGHGHGHGHGGHGGHGSGHRGHGSGHRRDSASPDRHVTHRRDSYARP
jgi:hypothetical protein